MARPKHRDSHERAFFVYDHQKHGEEADPKDAILYFYPPAVDIEEQIALVGGIIGTVDFCIEVLGYTPSVVSLTTCRFALIKAGPFILGLSSELQTPEQYVTQHLQFLWKTFCLFQGSLLAVRQRTGIDGFTLELNRIWNSYFSLCQSFSDQLSQAFSIIPYRDLSLSQSHVFLEASHILQRAQNCTGVIGGVLLNRNRVLCTQLSSELTRRLLVLTPSEKNFPCIEVKPVFELPGGVRLLSVFLTPDELLALGPRKQTKSQRRGTRMPDTQIKSSSSSSVSHSASSSPPPQQQQQQLLHQQQQPLLHQQHQQQQLCSAKPPYTLTAVVESAEIREVAEGEEFEDSESGEPMYDGEQQGSGVPVSVADRFVSKGELEGESRSAVTATTQVSDASNGGAHDKPSRCSSEKVGTDAGLTEEKTQADPKKSSEEKQTDKSDQKERSECETSVVEPAVLCGKDQDGSCRDGDVQRENRDSGDYSAAEDGAPDSERTSQICADRKPEEDVRSSPAVKSTSDPLSDSQVSPPSRDREASCHDGENSSTCHSDVTQSDREMVESQTLENAPNCLTSPEDSILDADGGEDTAHRTLAGLEADASRRSEDDGNSHFVATTRECSDSGRGESPDRVGTDRSSSTVVASPDSAFTSPGSVSSPPMTLPLDNSLASPTGDDDDSLLPSFQQTLGSPQTQVVHFDSLTKSIEEQDLQVDTADRRTKEDSSVSQTGKEGGNAGWQPSGEGSSVPVEKELHLDIMQSGTSSVLTLSDEMLSPNKERLNFETTLQNSGSSGSGSAARAAAPPERMREYSTEPSSSDIARSLENVSALSSSSTLLSSPSAGPSTSGPQARDTGLGGMKEVLLYVQGHMDTLLVLLLDDLSKATKENVNVLWKSSLAKLAELDFAVSDINDIGKDDVSSSRSYLYLKYDSSSQAMQGTAKTAVTSLANELVSSSVLLHDTFCSMPASSDILCRTHTTCCYGHKTMTSETFFQVQASKGGGYPDPRDIAFLLDQFADRKLYTDHSTALL